MGDEDFLALRQGIRRWGIVEPIAIQAKTAAIIGGHYRHKAAIEEGLERVPCVVLDVNDTEAMALNLALNKIHGEWDTAKLVKVLEGLQEADFDTELTGFLDEEIEDLLGGDEAIEAMDLRAPAATQWLLLGIPVDEFGKVQQHVAALEAAAEIVVRASRD